MSNSRTTFSLMEPVRQVADFEFVMTDADKAVARIAAEFHAKHLEYINKIDNARRLRDRVIKLA